MSIENHHAVITKYSFAFLGVLLIAGAPLISNAARPLPPQDFRYQIYSDTAAELFWSRTTNEPVQGYEITRNGELLGIFDALSYFDADLVPGIDYTYTLSAIGVDGEQSEPSSVILRTPQSADVIATLERQIDSLEQDIMTLEALLDTGFRSPVPKTGQTISELAGDDGDFQAGIDWPDPRFTINVDATEDLNGNGRCDSDTETCNGTVTDNMTGLIWLQNANCFGERLWAEAINDANNLAGDNSSGCGLTDGTQPGDWRLPNIKEIHSLMDYGHAFPTLLLPTDHPFTDVQVGGINALPSRYWTSTSIGAGSDGVYTVSLSVGWVERLSIGSDFFSSYVWPVRGGF